MAVVIHSYLHLVTILLVSRDWDKEEEEAEEEKRKG
jgi:hypothetical protein